MIELAWDCLDLTRVAGIAGRVEEAVAVIVGIAQDARAAGLGRTYGGLLECLAAGGLVELGRWSEADQLTETVAARGPSGIEAIALDVVRGTLGVGLGRFPEAAEHLRAAQSVTIGLRDGRLSGLVFDGLAELALWRGRLDEAAAAVVEGLEQVANTGDDEMVARLCLTGIRVEADRLAPPGGSRRDAGGSAAHAGELLETVQSLADRLARPGRPEGQIQAAASTALAEMQRLLGGPSAALWRTAVDSWARLAVVYPEAIARWRLAEAMLAEGSRTEGERELARAHESAAKLGATPLRERIEAVAQRAHVSALAPKHATPARAGAKPLGLTKREHEVLVVLATGRTNRQIASELFISEKTVSIHVSRILATLGVATRGEAAAIAHREGLIDAP